MKETDQDIMRGKHIVLGISGGIAAYKSAMLLRLFIKAGAEVQVVMTPNGREFITPATLAALSGKPVVSEFFAANTGEWHSHVDLGLWADLMVVAPATACTIGKMACGIADNMLVTTYLSAKEHVMVCPAMDLDMWAHPSTKRNVETLMRDGVEIVEPGSGELASHLTGKGRMAEPQEIFEAARAYFEREAKGGSKDEVPGGEPLKGQKVLVTAGPTYENIDPVRFIGNRSSGKMGVAIADELAIRGAEVVLVAGPIQVGPGHERVRRVDVMSAREMLEACEREFEDCTAAIMAAAVADYAPAETVGHKIKREGVEEMTLTLRRNPDIAATLGARKGSRLLVGFALETDDARANGLRKLERKNLDMVVVNSLADPEAGFDKDTNKITIIRRDGSHRVYPAKSKREVAADIIDAMYGESD